MKFKTHQLSETGSKITELFTRIRNSKIEILAYLDDLATELGFSGDLPRFTTPISCTMGLSGIKPDRKDGKTLDPKFWTRSITGAFYPKRNSNKGKAWAQKFASMPRVYRHEFNEAIGLETMQKRCFATAGVRPGGDYYLLDLDDIWDYDPPADVVEILSGEYERLVSEETKRKTGFSERLEQAIREREAAYAKLKRK